MLCKPQNSQLATILNESKKYNYGLTQIKFDNFNKGNELKSSLPANLT